MMGVAAGGWLAWPEGAASLEKRAREAAGAGRPAEAAELFAELNRGEQAMGANLLAEARARLAAGQAAKAEGVLRRVVEKEPAKGVAWQLWLELLRVEDRRTEAAVVAREALAEVEPGGAFGVRKAATLAMLAEAPDDVARPTLERWVGADADDLDARRALLTRRALVGPRQAGPAAARATAHVEDLEAVLARRPDHVGLREAAVEALAEAGLIARGRALLEGWPEAGRDARYARLKGRWALDYNRDPAEAERAFRAVLKVVPHDWRTRARLARALHGQGKSEEARREAEVVSRHRELMDPAAITARLASDLERAGEPEALEDLAGLCRSLGLDWLAEGWAAEAETARRAKAAQAGK
jgi:predicted Zn-dependent protease